MLLAVAVVSRPDRIKLSPKSRCGIAGPFLENIIGFDRSLFVAWGKRVTLSDPSSRIKKVVG